MRFYFFLVVCLLEGSNVLFGENRFELYHTNSGAFQLFLEEEDLEKVRHRKINEILYFDINDYYTYVENIDVIGTYQDINIEMDIVLKNNSLAFLIDFEAFSKEVPTGITLRRFEMDHDRGGRCFGSCARDRREAHMRRGRDRHSEETQRIVDKARRDQNAKDIKDAATTAAKAATHAGVAIALGGGAAAGVAAGGLVILDKVLGW